MIFDKNLREFAKLSKIFIKQMQLLAKNKIREEVVIGFTRILSKIDAESTKSEWLDAKNSRDDKYWGDVYKKITEQ